MTTVRERNDLINGFTDTQARDMLAILAGFDPAKFEAALQVLPEMQAIRDALAAAEASPANPYGSAKHGEYTAPSAAAVAQDVEPAPLCPECARDIATEAHQIGCPLDFLPAPTGHLPQHTHGERGCTHTGCHDAGHDLPAPTRVADAARLAAHAPEGAL